MLRILIALSIVFGTVLADPIGMSRHQSSELIDYTQLLDELNEDSSEYELARTVPDKTMLLFKAISALLGLKVSALSIAVTMIEWLISNAMVIVIGAATAIGFCKLTGKCSLSYAEYKPIAELRNMVTAEQLDTAQSFLVSAMEKYAESRNGRKI